MDPPPSESRPDPYRTLGVPEASGAGLRPPAPRDPIARAIVARFRALTGGRGTRDPDRPVLAACSGGADSSALVLALASARLPVTVAHVRHDLRPPGSADRDEDAARRLAGALGMPFARADACVADLSGNAEANARRLRERALVAMAADHGARFIATGHHGDDQIETLLLRITRGTGLVGLRGVLDERAARSPPIGEPGEPRGHGIRTVRPMLRVTRAQARTLCASCGWLWAEDETNNDTDRARNALRHIVLPALRAVAPQAGVRAAEAAAHLAEAHDYLAQQARALRDEADATGPTASWARDRLRRAHPALLAELLRQSIGHGADRVPARERRRWIHAVRDSRGDERVFDWPGLRTVIDADRVEVTRPDRRQAER